MVTGMFQSIRQLCAKQLLLCKAAMGAPGPHNQQCATTGEQRQKDGLTSREQKNNALHWPTIVHL